MGGNSSTQLVEDVTKAVNLATTDVMQSSSTQIYSSNIQNTTMNVTLIGVSFEGCDMVFEQEANQVVVMENTIQNEFDSSIVADQTAEIMISLSQEVEQANTGPFPIGSNRNYQKVMSTTMVENMVKNAIQQSVENTVSQDSVQNSSFKVTMIGVTCKKGKTHFSQKTTQDSTTRSLVTNILSQFAETAQGISVTKDISQSASQLNAMVDSGMMTLMCLIIVIGCVASGAMGGKGGGGEEEGAEGEEGGAEGASGGGLSGGRINFNSPLGSGGGSVSDETASGLFGSVKSIFGGKRHPGRRRKHGTRRTRRRRYRTDGDGGEVASSELAPSEVEAPSGFKDLHVTHKQKVIIAVVIIGFIIIGVGWYFWKKNRKWYQKSDGFMGKMDNDDLEYDVEPDKSDGPPTKGKPFSRAKEGRLSFKYKDNDFTRERFRIEYEHEVLKPSGSCGKRGEGTQKKFNHEVGAGAIPDPGWAEVYTGPTYKGPNDEGLLAGTGPDDTGSYEYDDNTDITKNPAFDALLEDPETKFFKSGTERTGDEHSDLAVDDKRAAFVYPVFYGMTAAQRFGDNITMAQWASAGVVAVVPKSARCSAESVWDSSKGTKGGRWTFAKGTPPPPPTRKKVKRKKRHHGRVPRGDGRRRTSGLQNQTGNLRHPERPNRSREQARGRAG